MKLEAILITVYHPASNKVIERELVAKATYTPPSPAKLGCWQIRFFTENLKWYTCGEEYQIGNPDGKWLRCYINSRSPLLQTQSLTCGYVECDGIGPYFKE